MALLLLIRSACPARQLLPREQCAPNVVRCSALRTSHTLDRPFVRVTASSLPSGFLTTMGRCSRSWLTFRLYLSPNVSQRMKGPLYLTLLLWIPTLTRHSISPPTMAPIVPKSPFPLSISSFELQQLHAIPVVEARLPPHSITSLAL